MKVRLPGIDGTLSVSFLFTLIGIVDMTLPETLLLGAVSTVAQFYWRPARQLKPVQLVFNVSQVALSSTIAFFVYRGLLESTTHHRLGLPLLIAAITYFACNTLAMSIVIGLTENKSVPKTWTDSYGWSFPYYVVGAAIAALIVLLNSRIGWEASLLVLPPIYLLYHSYRLHVEKLEAEKLRAEQMSSLHLRTIEALALAIEAKDRTTGAHLHRVKVFAMELARELHLSKEETEALSVASVLHDIGKIAIPEHILTKPGKLTREEFAKMKTHPVVGAEILEQVDFPYPVVPIVRAHHEKWDGSGYPDGLAGESIPIGARILAAVDYLDALASDRHYRQAIPLSEAMAKVSSEAGKSLDPRVVEVLAARYLELESLARARPVKATARLSTDIEVTAGLAPGAGFAEEIREVSSSAASLEETATASENPVEVVGSIAQLWLQHPDLLGEEDLLCLLAQRIKHFVPYDSIAIYDARSKTLLPTYVSGPESERLSREIPVGSGLCGWVAYTSKEILNGDPSSEFSRTATPTFCSLGSALVVPVTLNQAVVAVIALYRRRVGAFSRDESETLVAVASNLAAMLRQVRTRHDTRASSQSAGS
jgi:putative nucleotidyltransferase with HDIG domain